MTDFFGAGRLFFRAVVLVTDSLLMLGSAGHVRQLARVHVVEDPLRVLVVPLTLHHGQQQFGRVVLELQDEVCAPLDQKIVIMSSPLDSCLAMQFWFS